MPHDILLPDCDIQSFRSTFVSKEEYRKRVGEMSVKEALFDRKATSAFEENLKNHIVSKALVTVGAGGLRVTSYIVSDDPSSTTVYVSYGGGRLNVTSEGRDGDIGYFLVARQADAGVKLRIESRREHYKVRTWTVNAILIILGLVFGVIPGIVIALFVIFGKPILYRKKIEKFIAPALETTFGRIQ